MKKILFLASALFLGGLASAQVASLDLMERDLEFFGESGVAPGEDAKSAVFTTQYTGGAGWDMSGDNMVIGQTEYNTVVVYFDANRTNSGQITLNADYIDVEGNLIQFNDGARPDCQAITSALAGKATLPFVTDEGYTLDKIYLQAGWNDNSKGELPASDSLPLILTVTRAELRFVPEVPAVLNAPKITYSEFPSDYDFVVGTNYYLMPAWGWPDDQGASASVVETTDSGNALKMQPKNYGLAAIHSAIKLPAGKTVADIEKISFKVFWEAYTVPADETAGTEATILEEGAGVLDTKLILYLGDGSKLGGGAGFATDKNMSFIGMNPDIINEEEGVAQVGVIGEWFQYEVALEDFFDPTINNLDADAQYDNLGAELVATLNQFSFGIGFNANNGVFYIDDVTFVGVGGNSVSEVSAASANVFAVEGGLKIVGNEGATIYGIDGRAVATTSASFIALPKGVYIVKAGNEVVKAIVK